MRSVLLMEDLSNWQTKVLVTMLDKEEVIMCLKNVAIMHARFWGDKKKDISDFLEYVDLQYSVSALLKHCPQEDTHTQLSIKNQHSLIFIHQ